MKSHADALAELAKDFPEVAEILAMHKYFAQDGNRLCYTCYLLDLAATEHAQRKQLESSVEKLEGARNLLSILVLELTARKFRAPSVRSDPYSAELRHALNLARQWLDAADALAKEQPRE